MAPADLQTFAIAFGIVWGALALYLLRLHLLATRLGARLDALERR